MNIPFLLIIILAVGFGASAQEHPLKSELQSLTDRVDLLLGGKRSDDHKDRTTLRLKGDQYVAEHEEPKHTLHANVVTKIAVLERWQARLENWATHEEDKIESEIKDEFFQSKDEQDSRKKAAHESGSLASKHLSPRHSDWKFALDKNLSFRLPKHLEYGAMARARNEFMFGKLFHSFYQEVGWDLKGMWSADAEVESSVQISDSVLFTFVNGYDWEITFDKFATHHGPSLRHPLSETAVVTAGFSVGTIVKYGEWKVVSYSLASTYRQAFPKRNLYLQMAPAWDFSNETNYTGSASLMLTLGAEI